MTAYPIAPSTGVVAYLHRARARMVAILATSVLLFCVAAGLPAGGSTGGGMLSAATSHVAPSEAHAFLRFSPGGFNRWFQFQMRKQRPYCFGGPCSDAQVA